MDTMSNELRELGEFSTLELPKKVYACGNANASGRSAIRGVSVGSQFRTSLQTLVADLEKTRPHYIRCIKPNLTKSPSSFMSGEVLKQLRYSGMMEAIRIRREGYALREEHESFFNRFSVLLSSDELDCDEAGIVQLVKVLSKLLHVTDADWVG
jgi:myosin heavy subunit